jgi:hypothetical protein
VTGASRDIPLLCRPWQLMPARSLRTSDLYSDTFSTPSFPTQKSDSTVLSRAPIATCCRPSILKLCPAAPAPEPVPRSLRELSRHELRNADLQSDCIPNPTLPGTLQLSDEGMKQERDGEGEKGSHGVEKENEAAPLSAKLSEVGAN